MEILFNSISVSWVIPVISGILLFFDAIIYAVLQGAIEIMFLVGKLDMSAISTSFSTVIHNFNVLIGIYILFQMSLLFIQYLVEPDKFKDKSQGGAKLLKDVVITIILLVLLNSNILFGVFNDVQKIVFGGGDFEVLNFLGDFKSEEDTDMIQKIILGDDKQNHEANAHAIAVGIFEQFLFRFSGDYADMNLDSWYDCDNLTGGSANAQRLFCSVAKDKSALSFFKLVAVDTIFANSKRIHYTAIFSTVFGIYMITMFFRYASQLVLRFFKLILMQIISPIAIVSYATPKGKTTFNNFWKTYFSIYMELFLRLAIAYIAVYLILLVFNSSSILLNSLYSEGFIVKLIFKIILLIAINTFMNEMPGIISSLFGGKINDKQKSFGGILGGVLGGGIGLATGIGAARAAGAKGWGAAFGGAMGMFGGAKTGSSSQNVGAFVSGQISNASKATGRGFSIQEAGGVKPYLQMQSDRNFGGINKLRANADKAKATADYYSTSSTNLDALKDTAQKRYLKDNNFTSKESWVGSQLGEYDKQLEILKNGGLTGETIQYETGNFDSSGNPETDYRDVTIDDVLKRRAEAEFNLGETFDANVDKYLGQEINKLESGDESVAQTVNPELAQAYRKYNDHEALNAPKYSNDHVAHRITVDNDNKTNRKQMSDGAKSAAFEAQQKYAEQTSDQRYINATRK